MTRYIDMTPTWVQLLPTIRAIVENTSNSEAVWQEIARMAEAADKWNEHCKAELAKPVGYSEDMK
jgi:uncharacterized protein Yka (UPF0111/DUF47 family)